jgi:hypothetical protein
MMKKRIILLGTIGAAAATGLLYVLEANRRKQNNVNSDNESTTEPDGSGNGLRADTKDASEQTEPAASMGRIGQATTPVPEGVIEPAIDDQGTDQFEASQILREIRDTAFDASDEKLALALGRPTEEIEQWTSGRGLIDGDVVMKARALAIQRGLEGE